MNGQKTIQVIIILIMANLSTVCLAYSTADFDENGIVDFWDFSVLAYEWLKDPNDLPTNTTRRKTGGVATFLIGAYNASPETKARADYVCDGENDQVEIQEAIEALPMMSGSKRGNIHFTEGIFNISNPINIGTTAEWRGQVKLEGAAGISGTELVLAENANCSMFNIGYFPGDSSPVNSLVSFYQMRLNGNGSQQTEAHPLVNAVGIQDSRFEHVFICNSKGTGLYMERVWSVYIINCPIENNAEYQIHVYTPVHKVAWNLLIDGCVFYAGSESKAMIYLEASNATRHIVIRDSFFSDGPRQAIHLRGSCKDIHIVGNHMYDMGQEETGVYDAIYLEGYCERVSILDNRANCSNLRSFIGIEGTSTLAKNLVIEGNILQNVEKFIFMPEPVSASVYAGKNSRIYNKYRDVFMNCAVSSSAYVHAAIAGVGYWYTVTMNITNPDVPRNVSITTTDISSPYGSILVKGLNAKGEMVVENIPIVAGGTAYGSTSFATVISMRIPNTVSSSDTVYVGISDKLGLSNSIYENGDVYKMSKNGVDVPMGSVDVINGTVAVGEIAEGDNFVIYYKSNLNVIKG